MTRGEAALATSILFAIVLLWSGAAIALHSL